MESDVPEIVMETECPVKNKMVELSLDIYPFRRGDHGGVEVTHCSEFLKCNGIPSCGKDCMYNPDVQDVHLREVYKRHST